VIKLSETTALTCSGCGQALSAGTIHYCFAPHYGTRPEYPGGIPGKGEIGAGVT
jgi:hypothetical protein